MKKTYINPSIVVVRLAMTKPLATSDPNTTLSNDNNDAIAPSYFETKGISDINIWDDDDEW